MEQTVVDLVEHVPNSLGLFGQLDGKRRLEVRNELWYEIRLKAFDIRQREQDARVL